MKIKEDNSYNEMKGRSVLKWLNDLAESDHKVNSSSSKVTLEYIEYLNRKIKELEAKNSLKDEYLKKLKEKI
ncbi:hypothetical protein [Clostridium sp. SM-530-WT-3G]|uniref:hypothetical protein n=1 Tax=Clostridium sp. SM-530-WT-3G TaxID=2725303 RepID=UPI00145F5FCA|nr:hypothetical protein [Clostridium sp. SM-530-WT-3G]NME82142.1 hypothetical protein [Clostridium sp. SM-530-WT-3G]